MGRAARTSISAASAATGFSGFPHAAAPARSPGCPALSASPPRGAAIPAGGSAAGLYRGGGEMERQGQPTSAGEGGGGMQSAVLTAPLCTLGARPERELELGAHDTLGADLQSLWLITGAPLRDAPESGSPRLATHEKLSGNLHPHPLPPPRRRLLGVVRPGAAERGGGVGVGREKEEGRRGRWLSLRRAGRRRGGGKDAGSRGPGSPREV